MINTAQFMGRNTLPIHRLSSSTVKEHEQTSSLNDDCDLERASAADSNERQSIEDDDGVLVIRPKLVKGPSAPSSNQEHHQGRSSMAAH